MFTKSSWQIWNTATRWSIHDYALSQQTHQKGCRHSDSITKSPSPLPLSASCIISYPHLVYVLEKTEDTGRSTSHQFCVSSCMLFTQDTPCYLDICGNPVWPGTFYARYCTMRSLSWQGNLCQIHCSKHLPWKKKEKKWLSSHLRAPRSMQVTQNVDKNMDKLEALLILQLLLKHLLAKS